MDLSHLNALEYGHHNESMRLAQAKSEGEIALRTVWVAQLAKQISDERNRLGLGERQEVEMNETELLAELGL